MREDADHDYDLRERHDRLPKIVCRTMQAQNSLQHREIELWNCIPNEIKSCVTPNSFKKQYKSYLLGLYNDWDLEVTHQPISFCHHCLWPLLEIILQFIGSVYFLLYFYHPRPSLWFILCVYYHHLLLCVYYGLINWTWLLTQTKEILPDVELSVC